MDAKTLGEQPANAVFPETGAGHGAAFRGLTKRERFAMEFHAAQIASANPKLFAIGGEERAANALWEADALLAELIKEEL